MPRMTMLFLFWSAMLFAFTLAVYPSPVHLLLSDKWQHMMAFAVLATFASAAYSRLPLIALLIGLSIFGGLIEVVQALPAIHRDSDVLDWIADTFAVIVVLLIVQAWRLRPTAAPAGD